MIVKRLPSRMFKTKASSPHWSVDKIKVGLVDIMRETSEERAANVTEGYRSLSGAFHPPGRTGGRDAGSHRPSADQANGGPDKFAIVLASTAIFHCQHEKRAYNVRHLRLQLPSNTIIIRLWAVFWKIDREP